MEDNQPLNSLQPQNLIKKIFLYLNVSSFRANEQTTPAWDWRRSYHIRSSSVALLLVIEYATAKYLLHLPGIYFLRIAFFGLIIHTAIDLIFFKDIVVMAANYNAYYNKYLYYLFLLLVAVGIVGCLITLNNQIGHVHK